MKNIQRFVTSLQMLPLMWEDYFRNNLSISVYLILDNVLIIYYLVHWKWQQFTFTFNFLKFSRNGASNMTSLLKIQWQCKGYKFWISSLISVLPEAVKYKCWTQASEPKLERPANKQFILFSSYSLLPYNDNDNL